mmetsp:Transcript_27718/g.46119  ORF Transcript_27718/g.46119 Transcript_27718/m.46119 type:complete len:425 (+) Transcript_27718:50-1324(+)|eukprot:CAMPEP_0119308558 /NCGR_PEP_ID=MMETSP1333-20130426/11534_1 /TAXON_ID=418940 /ORGANISM="Scyphosphaera apsteinii, Strain RCC1455" /LENGTH=424 /DNA_ID=CAMNT_0007312361 /DNA_START=44 /DNA_END=1318 /DNA_ORIENTATION=+
MSMDSGNDPCDVARLRRSLENAKIELDNEKNLRERVTLKAELANAECSRMNGEVLQLRAEVERLEGHLADTKSELDEIRKQRSLVQETKDQLQEERMLLSTTVQEQESLAVASQAAARAKTEALASKAEKAEENQKRLRKEWERELRIELQAAEATFKTQQKGACDEAAAKAREEAAADFAAERTNARNELTALREEMRIREEAMKAERAAAEEAMENALAAQAQRLKEEAGDTAVAIAKNWEAERDRVAAEQEEKLQRALSEQAAAMSESRRWRQHMEDKYTSKSPAKGHPDELVEPQAELQKAAEPNSEELLRMPVKQLKEMMKERGIDATSCIEKGDFVTALIQEQGLGTQTASEQSKKSTTTSSGRCSKGVVEESSALFKNHAPPTAGIPITQPGAGRGKVARGGSKAVRSGDQHAAASA